MTNDDINLSKMGHLLYEYLLSFTFVYPFESYEHINMYTIIT